MYYRAPKNVEKKVSVNSGIFLLEMYTHGNAFNSELQISQKMGVIYTNDYARVRRSVDLIQTIKK